MVDFLVAGEWEMTIFKVSCVIEWMGSKGTYSRVTEQVPETHDGVLPILYELLTTRRADVLREVRIGGLLRRV